MRKANLNLSAMETMLDPELRKRQTIHLMLPTLNFIEPETMSAFIDMHSMLIHLQYNFSVRVMIFITQSFVTLLLITLLLYLDIFEFIDIQ